MTNKRHLHAISCSSKEILFLKSDSGTEPLSYSPPETFVSDLIREPTAWMDAFVSKLNKALIPDNRFHCAVIRITPPGDEDDKDKALTEGCLADMVDGGSGLWGRVSGQVFVLALWNLDVSKEETRFNHMKARLASTLHAQITLGIARFPFMDFTRKETFHNALKALDHAAFFGPDSLVMFDDVSMNISGDRLYETGQARDAAREYTRGLKINPRNLNLINSLGVCFGVMNKMDNALKEFQKAIVLDPGEVMAIYNAGLAANLTGDLPGAVEFLQKASRLNPEIFEVELTTGSLLLKAGQIEQAMIHLDRASQLNPMSSAPLRIIGDHYLDARKPDEAIPEFNKAIKLNPSDASALSSLARAFDMQSKNLDIAVTFARQAVSLVPDNPDFRMILGKLYLKTNQKKLAEAEFSSAQMLQAGSSNDGAEAEGHDEPSPP
ncbi:MAG: tetratricopeptide repeat protein [Pseudomonadota bacterium]